MLRLDVYLRIIRLLTARSRERDRPPVVTSDDVMILFADAGCPAMRSHPAWRGQTRVLDEPRGS